MHFVGMNKIQNKTKISNTSTKEEAIPLKGHLYYFSKNHILLLTITQQTIYHKHDNQHHKHDNQRGSYGPHRELFINIFFKKPYLGIYKTK